MSLSFPTISSSGCNGAIVHYCPALETARQLSASELYLCDSGAQYLDGTTDVTRTVSFGEPSLKQKVCVGGMVSVEYILIPISVMSYVTSLHPVNKML